MENEIMNNGQRSAIHNSDGRSHEHYVKQRDPIQEPISLSSSTGIDFFTNRCRFLLACVSEVSCTSSEHAPKQAHLLSKTRSAK